MPYAVAVACLWTLCAEGGWISSMAICLPQVQHSGTADRAGVSVPDYEHEDHEREQPRPPGTAAVTQPRAFLPSSVESVQWPSPPQDAVLQDAPYRPVVPGPATPPRWSGRRTAATAALALALTSAGSIAAAAATPHGIAGPAEQRGGPAFGNQQLGPGGPGGPGQFGQPGQPGQPGFHAGQQHMPGQGRTNR